MCFAKSSPVVVEPQEPVVRHEANASLTKNSKDINSASAFKDNIKTSPLGLDDLTNKTKKTLLGE
ncbi:MAG: hypothetical protein IJB79_03485 [Candidatus Gastranaerophilales bacterium]|nr:hypothetical protein [Candidatus Gastranaerophilales bacterium]